MLCENRIFFFCVSNLLYIGIEVLAFVGNVHCLIFIKIPDLTVTLVKCCCVSNRVGVGGSAGCVWV